MMKLRVRGFGACRRCIVMDEDFIKEEGFDVGESGWRMAPFLMIHLAMIYILCFYFSICFMILVGRDEDEEKEGLVCRDVYIYPPPQPSCRDPLGITLSFWAVS